MKTTVVTGMLGAGKTSFIQHYLRNAKERVVVLVNDFGKAGVDGEILSQGSADVIELPSGCVCCTLRFDLMGTLNRVLNDLDPEHLIIEPSGVASPSGVIGALRETGITRYAIVTIVDPVDFLDFYDSEMWGRFLEDQIERADILLINKTDIAPEASVSRTRLILERLNQEAVIFETTYSRIEYPITIQKTASFHHRVHPQIPLETYTLTFEDPLSYRRLIEFLDEISGGRFGFIIRAKGLVKTDRGIYRIDYASGQINIETFPSPISEARIVMIGNGLQISEIENFFVSPRDDQGF